MITFKSISRVVSTVILITSILILGFGTVNVTSAHAAGILYVSPYGWMNCSDWQNTCSLQTALATATSGDEIWVATGIYHPTYSYNQNATFQLVSGVTLYGGFAGTEMERDQRNIMQNPTILSGDLDDNDIDVYYTPENFYYAQNSSNAENSYHIVTGADSAILDGFVIKGGNAKGTTPNNMGGGMLNPAGSSMILIGITFSSNIATESGAGIDNQGTLLITNSTFYNNHAILGGGIYNNSGTLTINNSTFYNNTAVEGHSGGGISNWHGTLNYANTIIAASPYGDDCANFYGTIGTNINNLVQDGSCAASLNGDPKLGPVNVSGSTILMELLTGSPAIGAGDNATCSSTDQRGMARPQGLICDIGADEYMTDDFTPPLVTDFTVSSPSISLILPVTAFTATDNAAITGYIITETATAPSPANAFWTNSPPTTYTTAAIGSHLLYPWVKDTAGNVSALFDTPADVIVGCAAAISVTNTNDSGPGSLRQAIVDVCANGSIYFDSPLAGATIRLTSTLTLSQNVTIDGSTLSSPISINGDTDNNGMGNITVFHINIGVVATLNSLTITKGQGMTFGGGIYNFGILSLENCLITNNRANYDGAGVYNGNTLNVTNSIFTGNQSFQDGGGIYGGGLTITNSVFSGNIADSGGGIAGNGTITDSTFTGNSAVSGAGGGIHSSSLNLSNSIFVNNSGVWGGGLDAYGTVNIDKSIFLNNHANSGGGAIENSRTVTISNSTFVGNTSNYNGGGIYNYSYFPVNIFNSTFSGNTATKSGGSIYITGFSGGKLNYANTIIANSTSGGDCVSMNPIGTNINNLVEDGSCSAALSGDPNLDVLADNGGSTQTMALNAGSPAIDAGDSTICAADPINNKDQRGATRPTGSQCDIGAYEVGLAPTATPTNTSTITRTPTITPTPTVTPSSTATPSTTPTITLTATSTQTATSTETETATLTPTLMPLYVEIISPITNGQVITSRLDMNFEAVAWDPQVGTDNGNGIQNVKFSFSGPSVIPIRIDYVARYCAFSGSTTCSAMSSGTFTALLPGTYTLTVFVNALDGRTITVTKNFVIPISPTVTMTVTHTVTPTPTLTTTTTATNIPTLTNTVTVTKTATFTRTPTKTVTSTKTITKTATPVTVTLYSIGAQDGWVLESSETSGLGGLINNSAAAFNLGDDAADKQYRDILSFNTSSLPDTAVIIGVTLKLKKNTFVGGTNQITAFQGLMIDLKKGFFSTYPALQSLDFQATADKTLGPASPILTSNIYNLVLINGKEYINKLATNGGLTQIRLRFKLDDNDNAIANYISLFSGDTATAADRPQLVITYTVP